jgi:peptide/nickel transport system substrate-binding protein
MCRGLRKQISPQGGKIAYFDRMEWPTILGPATAAAALTSGEVDGMSRCSRISSPNCKRMRTYTLVAGTQGVSMAQGDVSLWHSIWSGDRLRSHGRQHGKARAMLKASEYNGEKVVILRPSDVPTIGPMGEITYDLLKRLGMNAGACSHG